MLLESVGNFKVYSTMLPYNSSSQLPFQDYYFYYLFKKSVSFDFFYFFIFFNLILFFKLYIIVLVLPNIKMNPHTHWGNQKGKRHVYPNVHRSTVYNSQDMEAT